MPNENGPLNGPPNETGTPAGDQTDRAHGNTANNTAGVADENLAADPLRPLKRHPIYRITDSLSDYMGVEKDLIQFTEFLSLCAGRAVLPVNIDVQSDQVAVDLHLANRILDLRHGHVARVDTHRQFRSLEQGEFLLRGPATLNYAKGPDEDLRPLAAVLVRGNHRFLHREVSEYTARLLGSDFTLPSIWRITDILSTLPPVPTTLRLQTSQACRELNDFGHAFAGYRCHAVEDELAELIESLPVQPPYPNPLWHRYRGKAQPEMMLVFERLLKIFVALRILLPGSTDKRPEVLLDDYEALRALLNMLPLVPLDRELTPQALLTGESLYKAVHESTKRLELPDLSQHGEKWFTRLDAMHWTGLAYNTAKKHLGELEDEGIVTATVAENNRERGRQIHYRFLDGREPPFEWRNPFERLPNLSARTGI